MSEECRCGHGWSAHSHGGKPGCTLWVGSTYDADGFLEGHPCDCKGWDVSWLPEPGERLEFGRHRLNTPEAEAAPAWPSLEEVTRQREAKFKREQKRVKA